MTKSNGNRIYLSPPHMGESELKLIGDAFDTNWIAPLGPHVDEFERELSEYVGAQGAVALNSGTAAIHLGLMLLGVGPGDVVFCSSLTFIASANPITYLGAEPVFIDSEPDSWNMSPDALERAFRDYAEAGRLPKAVIVVHLYGQSAEMSKIMEICDRYRIPILEDAAESLGTTYNGQSTGTFGKLGVYSFNGNKIITTSGGGMLVSDDLVLLQRARFLASQAREKAVHYQHYETGFNYRLSNVLAAIGRGQLQTLGEKIAARRAIFSRYERILGNIPGIAFMPELAGNYATRWLSVLTVDEALTGVKAAAIVGELERNNIESRPVWKPLHLQPVFERANYYPHLPEESVSERLFHTGLCLPSGSNLGEAEQARIIECVVNCLKHAKMDVVG